MKNKIFIVLTIVLSISLFLCGCKNNKDKKYNVTLMVDNEQYQVIEMGNEEVLDAVTLPAVEKELHNFVGWKDANGNLFTTTMTITSDITLFAEFEALPTVTLTIIYNDSYTKEYEVLSWEQITLADYIEEIDNYAFSSWEINGSVYSKEFIILDSDMTIKALYMKAPKPVYLANDYFKHGKISVS